MKIQKITPFIWLDHEAEEAANFYVSIFKNSKILSVTKYNKAAEEVSGKPAGSVMTVAFEIDGQSFVTLNGGQLDEATPVSQLINPVSFVVNCENQEEVDYFWEKLSEGGEKGVCGWINKDKFGVTWQVVPTILDKLISDPDPVKAGRAMEAMLKMTKIEINKIVDAYDGK
ncbi:MAG: 3-demethylubiquinone-9 3-methyltransferase [uncultured bacterium]|nr:MAG: 3-demethylubiquinone-9 3-methyltransferase [uncultured bacterium]